MELILKEDIQEVPWQDDLVTGIYPSEVQPVDVPRNRNDPVFAWRQELDEYYKRIRRFSDLEIDQIFRELAAMSGRASEIRSLLTRMSSRIAQTFRTQEIDMFLGEIDRQFKIFSRLQSAREMELRLSGGGL